MDDPADSRTQCHSCGASVAPSDNYCMHCGSEIGASEAANTAEDPWGGREATDSRDREQEGGVATGGFDHRSGQRREQPPWEEETAVESTDGKAGAPGTRRNESPFAAIGTAIGLSIAGIGVPLIVLPLLALVLSPLGLPGQPLLFVLTLMQFAWFGFLGVWYLRHRGYGWDDVISYFGVRLPTLKELGLVIVTWFVMLIAAIIVGTILMEVVAGILGVEDTEPAENPVGEIIEQNPELVIGAVAFMFLVVGPTEEILFRGVVQNRLRERFSAVPAIAMASVLFALVHIVALAGQDPAGIAMTISILTVTSLGLGWIYEYTGNLVVPTILHGFHNSVIVVLIALVATMDIEEEQTMSLLVDLLTVSPL